MSIKYLTFSTSSSFSGSIRSWNLEKSAKLLVFDTLSKCLNVLPVNLQSTLITKKRDGTTVFFMYNTCSPPVMMKQVSRNHEVHYHMES